MRRRRVVSALASPRLRVWLLTMRRTSIRRGRGREYLPCSARAVGEQVWPVEVADIARVADQAGLGGPDVGLAGRRLHRERQWLLLEVERHLMRRARRGARQSPAHARLDRAMQVAGHDALDLRMASDDPGELAGVGEAVGVHLSDPRGERRVVHEDQGRTRGRFLEPRREPTQTLRAEEAAHSPRIERVEADEPYRMALRHGGPE